MSWDEFESMNALAHHVHCAAPTRDVLLDEHLKQALLPVWYWYVPSAQGMHAVALLCPVHIQSEKILMSQPDTVPLSGLYVPTGQALISLGPVFSPQ